MSEEKKRRTRTEEETAKEEEKEAFETGRILGVIARRNPDLYRALKDIIDFEGRKTTEILEDALQMYVEYRTESAFMPRQLFYAMKMVERVSRWSIEMLVRMLQVVLGSSQLLMSEEEEKRPAAPSMQNELRAKMVEVFMPILQNILTMLFSSLTSITMRNVPGQQQNIAMQMAQKPLQSLKVVSSKKKEQKEQNIQ